MQPGRPGKGPGRREPSCSRDPSSRIAKLNNPGLTTAAGDAQQIQSKPEDLEEDPTNLRTIRDVNRDSGFERGDCSVATPQQTRQPVIHEEPAGEGTIHEDSSDQSSNLEDSISEALIHEQSADEGTNHEDSSDQSSNHEDSISEELIHEELAGEGTIHEDSSDQSSNHEDSTSEVSTDNEEMARANRKFERPPSFSGLMSEDAIEWADRYDKIGDYNVWTCKDKHDNIFMYLKGSAEKWFKALTPKTTTWLDVTTTVGGADVVTEGAKTRLLKAFNVGNYQQFYANKLQNRVQEMNESGVVYYFDVVALCSVVDPNMTEPEKVNHLMRGLGASLLKSIYPRIRDIKTSEEFLIYVRLEEETTLLALCAKREASKCSLCEKRGK